MHSCCQICKFWLKKIITHFLNSWRLLTFKHINLLFNFYFERKVSQACYCMLLYASSQVCQADKILLLQNLWNYLHLQCTVRGSVESSTNSLFALCFGRTVNYTITTFVFFQGSILCQKMTILASLMQPLFLQTLSSTWRSSTGKLLTHFPMA